ncbi:MAG: acyltransferase [Microthrixaceae bacterium]|nr:acyltransferase [Microthrixaceae bacterium]MCO5321111.1 acyltransferase [Microthrixaceae bacterium]
MIGTDRLAYVDVMRTVAVVRVVINHALPWPWLKWFESLPVMFFVSGTLVGRSLRTRSVWAVFRGRFSRLALPWGAYIVFDLTMKVTGGLPDTDEHLWYIWTFLAFVALSGVFRWLIRWSAVGTLSAQAAVLVALTVIGQNELAVGMAYQMAWVAGMVWAERDCVVPSRRFLLTTTFLGFAASVLAVAYWLGLGSTITPSDPNETVSPSSLGISMAGLGAAWLAVGMLLRGPLEASMHVRGLGSLIRYLNKRLLTVYLWHLPATIVARQWSVDLDLDRYWSVVFVLGVTLVLTGLATVLFGRLEDRASKTSKRVKQRAEEAADGQPAAGS